jgi:hypothetical protein
LHQGLHLLESVPGSAAGQHGLGQRDPKRLLNIRSKTRYKQLAGFRLGIVEPAGPGENGDQLGGDRVARRVG